MHRNSFFTLRQIQIHKTPVCLFIFVEELPTNIKLQTITQQRPKAIYSDFLVYLPRLEDHPRHVLPYKLDISTDVLHSQFYHLRLPNCDADKHKKNKQNHAVTPFLQFPRNFVIFLFVNFFFLFYALARKKKKKQKIKKPNQLIVLFFCFRKKTSYESIFFHARWFFFLSLFCVEAEGKLRIVFIPCSKWEWLPKLPKTWTCETFGSLSDFVCVIRNNPRDKFYAFRIRIFLRHLLKPSIPVFLVVSRDECIAIEI